MYINRNFPSPNFSERNRKIEYIIIHYTEIPFSDALSRLRSPEVEVSSHYLIKADGQILQLVEDHHKAWHAGESFWQGHEKLNENSIGIEMDNHGNHDFTTTQMEACVNLCQHLVDKHSIPNINIIGHSDIACGRKIDPGILFDWQYLAKHNLGMWHDVDLLNESPILLDFGDQGSKVKELQTGLNQLGYKIEPSGRIDKATNYVIRAFQAHFYPVIIRKKGLEFYNNPDSLYQWDEFSDAVLKELLQKI